MPHASLPHASVPHASVPHASPADFSARLDPVRLTRRPAALLRLAAVAALLLLAAGALYADPGGPAPSGPAPNGPGADGPGADGPGADGPAPSGLAPGVPAPGTPAPGAWGAGAAGAGAPGGRPLPVPPGLVGVPVRLADPASLAVLRPGDRVDLVSMHSGAGPATLVSAATVLDAVAAPETPVLYLAVTDAQARAVLSAPKDARLAVMVRSRQ